MRECEWIKMAWFRDQWQALEDTVVINTHKKYAANCLASRTTISFQRAPIYGVNYSVVSYFVKYFWIQLKAIIKLTHYWRSHTSQICFQVFILGKSMYKNTTNTTSTTTTTTSTEMFHCTLLEVLLQAYTCK